MINNITFRPAILRDMNGIYENMLKAHYISFSYPNKPKKEIIKDLRDKFKKIVFLVAVKGKKIIGYSMYDDFQKWAKDFGIRKHAKGKYAYSLGIGIHPDYRGKGIGKMLKLYTLEQVKSKLRLSLQCHKSKKILVPCVRTQERPKQFPP